MEVEGVVSGMSCPCQRLAHSTCMPLTLGTPPQTPTHHRLPRRLELFGEEHNIRDGWVTVGRNLPTSNFRPEVYASHFKVRLMRWRTCLQCVCSALSTGWWS